MSESNFSFGSDSPNAGKTITDGNKVFHSLPVPEDAKKAEQAVEVIRAWIVDQQLTLTLSPNVFNSPEVWGTLLADTAYHIASAMAQLHPGTDIPATVMKMHQAFNTKMNESWTNRGQIDVAS
jgi:hypothetical protein